MRISDWSSDVCSSDLVDTAIGCIGAACRRRIDERQKKSEHSKRGEPRRDPQNGAAKTKPHPEGKAAGDLGERSPDIHEGGCHQSLWLKASHATDRSISLRRCPPESPCRKSERPSQKHNPGCPGPTPRGMTSQ